MPSIYLRGTTYWARVQHKGKEVRRSLETPSRSIASERLKEFVADVTRGKWKDSKGHSYTAARDKFVREHCKRIRPKSAKRYITSLVALDAHFQDFTLDEITSAALSEYETARRAKGRTNGTIRRDLSCLSSIFTCAEEWEWVTSNPVAAYMRKAQKRGLKEAEPRTRYLSHEEQLTLLDQIERTIATTKNKRHLWAYQQLRRAIILSIETGLRAEELFSLTWRDVDIDTNRLTVRRELAKSGKQRTVPLQDRALKVIDELPRRGPFVICKKDGTRYKDMYDRLVRMAKRAGIPDLEWHDLRKTCGCRLLQDQQLPIEHVSMWLGHSTIEQTRRAYAFLDVRHLEQRLQSAPRRLEPPK
jgi:integrase